MLTAVALTCLVLLASAIILYPWYNLIMMHLVTLRSGYDSMDVCMCEEHFKRFVDQKPGEPVEESECDPDAECEVCEEEARW